MKSYTDLEQSRKLAEILPLESADMQYYADAVTKEKNPRVLKTSEVPSKKSMYYTPCWSLAALFSTLPILGENKDANPFIAKTTDNEYYVVYATLYKEIGSSDVYDNPIDACVDIIEYLCKQKLL